MTREGLGLGANSETRPEQIRDTLNELQDQVDGIFLTSQSTREKQWIPTVRGSTSAGVASYSRQYALVYRQNDMVDVHFDVQWTGHTGTGDIELVLPYEVTRTPGRPFVGNVAANGITYAGDYVVLVPIPNQIYAILQDCISVTSLSNVALTAAGGFRGSVRYVGALFG